MSIECGMLQMMLDPFGGMTETVFPITEATFKNNEQTYDAVMATSRLKNVEQYESVMDFMFCELYTHWKRECFKFYKDKGPALKDHPMTQSGLLTLYDAEMSQVFLPLVWAIYQDKRKNGASHRTWDTTRSQYFILLDIAKVRR